MTWTGNAIVTIFIALLLLSPTIGTARTAGHEISDQPQKPNTSPFHEIRDEVASSSGAITMLANGDYFPVLLNKIRNAKTNIDLTMFVFKTSKTTNNRPGLILKELTAAAQRGAKIRVFLERSGYDKKLNKTNQQTADQLREHGIKVIFDSTKITTHNKLIVIDHRFSFVGSHNFTHAALKYNNELSLLIDSKELAEKLTGYMEELTDN